MFTRTTITKTCDRPDLADRLAVALRFRPDWALSLTVTKVSSDLVRITYSDRLSFGVPLDEAMNYCVRHGV
jgi:hypothetical protein